MRIIKVIAVLLVSGGPMVLQGQPATPADQPAYSLAVRSTQSEAKVGELINIDITLTNTTDKAFSLEFEKGGRSEFSYLVLVNDQQGAEVPYTPYFRAVRGMRREPGDPVIDIQFSTRLWTVQPGKSATTHMDITRLYKIEVPGTYTVWVERLDRSSGIRVKSNTVSVSVNP